MPATLTQAAPMRGGGLLFFFALLVVSSPAMSVLAGWQQAQQPSIFPEAEPFWGQSNQQVGAGAGGWANPYDQALPYPTSTATASYGTLGFDSQQSSTSTIKGLSLEDLPVDTELLQGAGASAAGESATKRKGSLRAALVSFFANLSLVKVLVVVAAFALSFFTIGILSRIVQVVASIYISLKVLQLIQENEANDSQ